MPTILTKNLVGRKVAITVIFLTLMLSALTAFGQTQQSMGARELPPNQTLEREMMGAETHRYKFELNANEFFQVRVEQKGVDVALKLSDVTGNLLATMDSPNSKEGPETLSFVATVAGNYTLEVSGFDTKAEKGNYAIRREASRTATAQDRRRVDVERLFIEGMTARDAEGQREISIKKLEEAQLGWQELHDAYLSELTAQQVKQLKDAPKKAQADALFSKAIELANESSAESMEASLSKFDEARGLYSEIADKQREANCLGWLGKVQSELGDPQKALEFYNLALQLYRAVDDRGDEATTLNNIGLVYSQLGEKQKALGFYNRALPLYRAVGDRSGEATTLGNIGSVNDALGEKQKALEFYNLALPLFRALGDRGGEAMTLNNIGSVNEALGENQKARESFDLALPLVRAVGDRGGEAATLSNIGSVYDALGEKQKALEYYNLALPIVREVGDRGGEGTTLNNIGLVYSVLGEKQKALEFYNLALPLRRAVGDRSGEAATLNNIGLVHDALGEKRKALEFYNLALPLFRAVGDRGGEATTLNNIGFVYDTLGEKQKALEFYNLALPLFRAVGDRGGEATTLVNIGTVYDALGEKQKALEFYNLALPLFRAVGDRGGEATTLNDLGLVYSAFGEKQKELEFFNMALPLYRAIGDPGGEAATLNNIGGVYDLRGEKQKALEFYNLAWPLFKAVGDRSGEASTLGNIGGVYSALGEMQKALEFYNRVLPLFRAIGDRGREATTLNWLRVIWLALNNPRLAIFYGKQSVNKYQELRQAIQGLDKETQKTYLKSIEPSYRKLADILIAEGRFAQAEQVLAMLKEEEYFDFVRRDADEIKNLNQRVPLNDKEQKLIARYSLMADRITTVGQEFLELDEKKRKLSEGASLPSDEQKHYYELSAQLTDANAAFKLFLEQELVAELGKETIKEIEYDRNLQAKLRKWGAGTVALRTVVTGERYRVILTTPTVQVDGKTEIKADKLNEKIFAFRKALQDPKVDPRPLGKEIYDILIKPIEKDLQAAEAKTLVWSLDGTLRYIPLAALSPDGKVYLAEKFQNAIITRKTEDDIFDSNAEWQALGVGVSTPQSVANPDKPEEKLSFDPLPGTKEELLAIVRDEKAPGETGVLVGRRYLDNDFTMRNLTDSLTKVTVDGKRKYTVVHIASHFRLGSNWSNSFLLLGNGQVLTLEQVSNSPEITFGDVELITLSACNTAFADDSNGKEVDSLAEAIQAKYGKAVLATLWSVADESTSILMSEFYRLLKQNPQLTKAAALQMAQQEMIAGKLKPFAHTGTRRKTSDTSDVNTAPLDYSHPYYWSPFVLIGNWR